MHLLGGCLIVVELNLGVLSTAFFHGRWSPWSGAGVDFGKMVFSKLKDHSIPTSYVIWSEGRTIVMRNAGFYWWE